MINKETKFKEYNMKNINIRKLSKLILILLSIITLLYLIKPSNVNANVDTFN